MSIPLDMRPKVRQDLTITTEMRQGEEMIVVSDPWGLLNASLLLSDKVHTLFKMLDGKRTLAEIERGFALRHSDERFSLSELTSLVEQFDRHLLLDNARYRSAFEHQVKGFLESSVRLPAHAGISYPETAEALTQWVDDILALPPSSPPPELASLGRLASAPTNGVGQLSLNLGGPANGVSQPTSSRRPVAVVAPHLDPRVETASYGDAYRDLKGMEPDRVILLGTGHDMRGGLFSLTFKSYFTPLGEVPTDLDAVDLLLDAGQFVCSPHDLAHRTEHALEFQLPFLQRVLARPDIPVVPVLCGSLHRWYGEARKFEDIPYIDGFVDALASLITPETLVVVGVDFAHVGHKFGHERSGRALHQAAHTHDHKMLESLCTGDLQSFWRRNASMHDRYNLCGFSSLSLLMAAMPGLRGEVRRHDYWFEDETNSAVSFAAVHLYE